jgi:hypothetical protein
MRKALGLLVLVGCTTGGGSSSDGMMMGDDMPTPDSMDPQQNVCAMESSIADTGALTSSKTQRCNVQGSSGARKWYRMMVALPGSPTDIVQLELWDGQGAFSGGAVRTGTFQLTGAELDYQTCGVCLRAVGDKGAAGQ